MGAVTEEPGGRRPHNAADTSLRPDAEARIRVGRLNLPVPILDSIRSAVRLKGLPKGWNSYNAATPKEEAIEEAIAFLVSMVALVPNLAAPAVVPTAPGGVQLEWQRRGVDIEVEFEPTGAASWCADHAGGESATSRPLDQGRDEIIGWLRRASDPATDVTEGPKPA